METNDERMAAYVAEGMINLSANGSHVTEADVFNALKFMSSLSKRAYERLQLQFEEEQPSICASLTYHIYHVYAPKDQVRELRRIALVAWLTYKLKQPNLPTIAEADWGPAEDVSYLEDLANLPHKQVLALLMTMFAYRLNTPKIMETELGFLLFDLLTRIIVALDIVYLRSSVGCSYADACYRVRADAKANIEAGLELDTEGD